MSALDATPPFMPSRRPRTADTFGTGCTPTVRPEVPMFESCCSPRESAHVLRARYGLPVELYADRPLLTLGAAVEALTLPEPLGRQVLDRLSELPSTPVIADPRDRRWTFLVAPPLPNHRVPQRLRTFLQGYSVTLPAPGTRIMLPTSDQPGGWHWADEPEPGGLRLPHRAVALSAVRRAILEGPPARLTG
ncbi:hypothetical protein [Nocardia sp. NPDC005825]|uniref:hypothetical protein n=2 Tax=unclassified Nocardia TaxID=2637762 RepID=UPI0033BFD325